MRGHEIQQEMDVDETAQDAPSVVLSVPAGVLKCMLGTEGWHGVTGDIDLGARIPNAGKVAQVGPPSP